MVARRIGEALPHAEVPLGRQDGFEPERQLNLLDGRVTAVRQFGECAAAMPNPGLCRIDDLAATPAWGWASRDSAYS
jgi:hypothetical protein